MEKRTRAIVDAVKARGDEAVLEFTQRFDGAMLTAEQLKVTQPELLNASLRADESLRKAVAMASKNIEAFSRKSLRKNWSGRNAQGAKVGEKFDAFQRVGIYIPGGSAPLVSTALMTVVLARVAGCKERSLFARRVVAAGEINSALLFAARAAGSDGDLSRWRGTSHRRDGARHGDDSACPKNIRAGKRLRRCGDAVALWLCCVCFAARPQ